MLNILFFNLITYQYIRNKNIAMMFILNACLDIFTTCFIGVHALATLLVAHIFAKDFTSHYNVFALMILNYIILNVADIQTMIFYGYAQLEFNSIMIIYVLLCSIIFTHAYQRDI